MAFPALPRPARPAWFLLAFALANMGGVIAYLPLLTLLLPLKIHAIAGDARIPLLSLTAILGAVAASAANVLFGWLSDRSVARGGGRRRWVAGGLVATAASYVLVASASTAVTIVAAVVLFQVAVNAVLAPLLPIMADEVPDARKGLAAGLIALGNPVAALLSAVLVADEGLADATRLAVVPLLAALALLPLLLLRGDGGGADETAPATAPLLPRRDLLIAAAARLLMQLATAALSLYLLYVFESIAPGERQLVLARQVGTLLTICYVIPLPLALLVGRWSDRVGRRQPFLVAAGLVAVAGLGTMALAAGTTAAAIGFATYSVGSAVFLALHSAFALQLLPDPRRRGRDLGLLNLTNTLPALLGPLLTWTLATPRDFALLLTVLAVLTALGTGAVTLVRARR
ncbi:MFS transporter [Sphingomonas sp. BK345]|uniref:MFS transporter n=1 Tax=Sphingomonas sp. BK345 TaxID=2586980 RepID=UPI00161A6B3E|nr:MFS transporter [Sphingomonas sp. BK345]MBB3475784.1 MFS family permease [Sphingomonas sp. BK345]